VLPRKTMPKAPSPTNKTSLKMQRKCSKWTLMNLSNALKMVREEAQVRKAQNQRRTKIRRLIRPLLIFRLELCLKRASNHHSSSPPQREAIWLCVKQALLKPLQLVLLTQRKIRLLQVISNRRKPRLQALMRKKPGRIRLTNAVLQLAQLTMKQTYK
jgi:hypothetical protein